jgi:hypothetical protein
MTEETIELTFEITKEESGMLIIKPSRSFTEDEFYDFIQGDDLFFKDLYYYHSCVDMWQFIYDANKNLVYIMDDYGYNLLSDLQKGKEIKVMGRENNEDYQGYEWNEKQ